MKPYMFTDPKLKESFSKYSSIMKLPEGAVLMNPGEPIRFIPLVKSGCIRVLRQNDEGKEVFLYHIMPGETCAMSLTCCNVQSLSEVKAVAEEETEVFTVPVTKLEEWQNFKEWRDYISNTYKVRFERMMQTIDDLAFENMDERLWRYLLARSKAKGSTTLQINHEEMANELNIQRESATRLLKKLKDLGYLETGRGQVTLLKNE
ncbi:MAG: Crp/Fnr family transcriptional regulator [Bacteroidia bacterium]|nr:Crp/Fnr family transcriptional regulator [Bacteroidia bacterium]